jgi:hypothetical protein
MWSLSRLHPDKADAQYLRLLLRARHERPRDRRTTDKGDEFPSPHDALETEDSHPTTPLNERVVRHSKIGRPTSGMGQERRIGAVRNLSALPSCRQSRPEDSR